MKKKRKSDNYVHEVMLLHDSPTINYISFNNFERQKRLRQKQINYELHGFLSAKYVAKERDICPLLWNFHRNFLNFQNI